MVTLPKQGGGRHRRYFRTEGEAKTYLQRKRVELLNQGTASLAITDPQRVALLKAEELLAPEKKRHISSRLHREGLLRWSSDQARIGT
jgi:hypothetical protein